eukprot:GHVR01094195.1.p1 GENE.GHVR01094195.1~~GHVR01094195.1.p1  ORF type:complete len:316 (-),score=18.95 GHVR01094195.1:220-1167(-)
MLPALGQIQRPHFRHRDLALAQGNGCSPEGILHSTTKLLIAEVISTAINTGRPYPLQLAQAIACPQRKKILKGNCRHRIRQDLIDLARFTSVSTEAQRDSFRYDILLEDQRQTPLAIEIAVSSPATQEKKRADIPVIEITINNESDIEHLLSGIDDRKLGIEGFGMEAHFGPAPSSCVKSYCASPCLSYSVMSGGSVRLEEQLPFEACQARPGRDHHIVVASKQAFALSRFEALDRLTRKAYYSDKAPVRSCLVCRHHEIADFSSQGDGAIMCLQDGKRGSVNRGTDCLYFTPFATIEEVRRYRLQQHVGTVIDT